VQLREGLKKTVVYFDKEMSQAGRVGGRAQLIRPPVAARGRV
jgi:hypothetical protein